MVQNQISIAPNLFLLYPETDRTTRVLNNMQLLSDPCILIASICAVTLAGLSKGGFGGTMGMLGVPIMALVISPVQAAAILLPIYIIMDIFSLWSWRREFDLQTLKIMLPAGVVGIAIGWITAAYVSDSSVRLLVGIISVGFVVNYYISKLRKRVQSTQPHRPLLGGICGTVAGFTSFIAHTGGPPYQVYTLPLGQSPRIFTGTSVRFFFIINVIKLVPYFALGQFDATNLKTSFALMPLAVISTLVGAWIVKRMRPDVFYPLMYVLMLLAGMKLLFDGLQF